MYSGEPASDNPRAGTLLAEGLTTDANGQFTSVGKTDITRADTNHGDKYTTLADGLPVGKYYVLKTAAPDYSFNVANDGTIEAVGQMPGAYTLDGGVTVTAENEKIELDFFKQDTNGMAALAGIIAALRRRRESK